MAKKHIFYFDALRALAIISVAVIHATGMLQFTMPADMNHIFTSNVLIEAICNNSFRIGVDLFLMLSGALSLGREWKIREFLSKRIPRITKPFVFWALFTSLMLIAFSYFFTQINYIDSFDLMSILEFIKGTFLTTSPGSAQYWFFWMILGTYLIMPIFNKWLQHCELEEVEYFLAIWIFVSIVENTLNLTSPIKLSYFTSPIGLVVLGYYLRYTKRGFLNNTKIAVLLILLSSAIMLICSYLFFDGNFFKTFDRYSILNIIEVIGIFCLFKTSSIFENPNRHFKTITEKIAKTSYGIYLIHGPIMKLLVEFLPINIIGFKLELVLIITLSIAISYILVTLISRISFLEEFSGSK